MQCSYELVSMVTALIKIYGVRILLFITIVNKLQIGLLGET
jgi:hypothetical protein